jgi:hypothetical protein
VTALAVSVAALAVSATRGLAQERETVRAEVQLRPGGPVEEVEMSVQPVPVDPPTVAAAEVDLDPDELVLGVVLDGRPVAYPIRYLALSEVVNDRVGETSIAPSW